MTGPRSDDGDLFTVVEYQRYIKYQPLSGDSSLVPTLKRYVLADGSAVNQIDAETYEIVRTNQIIRKIG